MSSKLPPSEEPDLNPSLDGLIRSRRAWHSRSSMA
jgi:hypothetical protein